MEAKVGIILYYHRDSAQHSEGKPAIIHSETKPVLHHHVLIPPQPLHSKSLRTLETRELTESICDTVLEELQLMSVESYHRSKNLKLY